jgi:hypothetical protein
LEIYWVLFLIYLTAKHFFNLGYSTAVEEMQEAGILPKDKEENSHDV